MKKLQTIAVLVALLALPTAAFAQNGYYTWTISASNSDPFVNNPPNPGSSLQTLYLHYVQGCFTSPPGMSAAEFKIIVSGGSLLAFNVSAPFLNAGSGANLLLAVGACPTGPLVAGSILFLPSGGPFRLSLGVSDPPGMIAATVDCRPAPDAHQWPALVRFVGYATQDAGVNQNHGQDCNVTPVDDSSWGAVKGLYR